MAVTEAFEEEGGVSGESAVSVVKVAGKSYAVGLVWNEVTEKSEALKEARAMAARPQFEADLFAMRAGGEQFGLGWRRNGHAKGMPSLAGHMADARAGTQGSWIGLFEIEDGYYLVAVRDDVILAQTDKVFADEMVARSQFEDLLGIDWTEIFAPEAMGFDNAQALTADQLVGTGKPPRLVDVDKVSGIVKWGGGVLVALVLLLGGMWWMDGVEQQRLIEEAERLRVEAEKNLPLSGRKAEVQVPPMPWDGKPVAAAFLTACSEGMRKAVLDFPGWTPVRMECEGSSTNVRMLIDRAAALGKGGGTINWVRWTLDRSPELAKATAMPVTDTTVAVTWTMGAVESWKPELASKTPDIGKARFYMQSWFEEAFTPISFPNVEQNTFWRTAKFRFETTHDPVKFSGIIGKIPGATIDKVSLDLRGQIVSYIVEGAIHEQMPLPEGAKVARAGQPQASASAAPPPAPP